jgi:hypothetical protein
MIPGLDKIQGKWMMRQDCPLGGKHEWEDRHPPIDLGEEIRTLKTCSRCGMSVWHVVQKKEF